jgi:hypothetical protein
MPEIVVWLAKEATLQKGKLSNKLLEAYRTVGIVGAGVGAAVG